MLKTRKLLLTSGILLCSSLFIPALAAAEGAYVDTFEIALSGGARVDDFKWDIGGYPVGSPDYVNVLSELVWEDIVINQIGVAAKIAFGNQVTPVQTYFRGSFNYGQIMDGDVQQTDYAGPNRTAPIFSSTMNVEDDDVLDATIAAGLKFELYSGSFILAPVGGFSYHEQNFRMNEGFLTALTYKAKWNGPWLGSDFELVPSSFLKIFGSFEYHFADYEANANWDLRSDYTLPVHFKHDARDANGVVASLGGRLDFSRFLALHLSLNYQNWHAEDGVDLVYFADGSIDQNRLNEVSWESYAAMAGVDIKFY